MKERLLRIKNSKKMPLILAFCIPFFLALGVCIGHEIYPFGNQCFLHIDMYHQYAPFFTEFMNKLKSGSGLLYTWNLGLGTDFVSLMAYYLSSPFNWLLLLCPSNLVIEFMTVLILIKTGLSGLTFAFYLNRHYKDNGYRIALFAVFYALSGFMCAYNWDIMWLDTVVLLPLILLGLERLVEGKKMTLYVVTLAVSILSNYYISIMVCIYLVLYFVILISEQKSGRGKAILKFAAGSILAGGMGAILILPEIVALSGSGSGGISFPEKMEWYFGLLDEAARFCIGVEPSSTVGHMPNLYCGAAILLLLFLYLLNRRIRIGAKIPRLLLVAFFFVSFANNKLDFIWHGFHFPDGLPARQTFLFAFLLLTLGYEAVREERGNSIFKILFAFLLAELVLVLCFRFTDLEQVTPEQMLLTGLLILGYALLLLFYRRKDKTMRTIVSIFAVILVCAEAGVNLDTTSISTTSRTLYTQHLEDYKTLAETAEAEDDGFFRMDKFNRMTKNESALSNYASASIFSSLINKDVADFYREMGMEGGKNYYCYNGATMLTSSLLSVKYILTDSAEEESPYRSLISEQNGIYLYENTYTLPLGFMVDSDLMEKWDFTLGTPIMAQNELAYALGATENLLEPVDAELHDGKTVIQVTESGYYYGYYTMKDAKTITATTGNRTRTFSKCDHVYLLDLGYCEAGEDITLISADTDQILVQGYRLNDAAFQSAYHTLSQQTMELKSYSDSRIEGSINVEKTGTLLLSVPDDEGWHVFVDGEEVDYEHFCDAFISIPLKEGSHEIVLKYTTPNLKLGALLSGGALFLFLCITWIPVVVRKRGERA